MWQTLRRKEPPDGQGEVAVRRRGAARARAWNEALATEIVCVLRYKRDHFKQHAEQLATLLGEARLSVGGAVGRSK